MMVTGCCLQYVSAQNLNTPNNTGPLGIGVNTLTGNTFISRMDAYVVSRGIDMNMTFYYNSFDFQRNIGFGNGWSMLYCMRYRTDSLNNKIITWGDGREDTYKPNGAVFTPPSGIFTSLSQYQANKYLLTMTGGMKFYFDNSVHRKITRMEEPNGNYLNFTYSDSLLTTITNAAGQSISLAYNGNGNLQTLTDAITSPTRITTYEYDGNKNLVRVTDPLGGKMKYAYLVNGPMKSMTDKNNNTVDIIYYGDLTCSELIGCNKRQSYSYDTTLLITTCTDYLASGNNQVTRFTYQKSGDVAWLSALSSNCCGFNMNFTYDQQGNKISETDANGNITHFTYDSRGNVLTITNALGQTQQFTYTPDFNQVSSFTDEKGFTTSLVYDVKGNLVQLTEPGNLIYTATYAGNGDILSSTDPKGNVFSYSYDSYGNPVSVSGPNGYHASIGNDARGNLVSFTDARGNKDSLEFDILNRLKKITDPLAHTITYAYDSSGNLTSFRNQNNQQSAIQYDASNRPVMITDALGHKTSVSYDAMDNIVSVKNALGNITGFTYDNRNRVSSVTDALGHISYLSYDPDGNITAVNLPTGETVSFTYDALNRIKTLRDNTGNICSYNYDPAGNMTSITNGAGGTISLQYDNKNRVTRATDLLGNSTIFGYDNNDNVVSITDRNNHTRNITYDSLDRVKTVSDNLGNMVTAGYDSWGNITSLTDQNNHITTYTYDSLNRIKRVTYPDSRYLEYTYDNIGNVISKRVTDGTIINIIYDSLNRIVSKTLPGGNNFSYTYDSLNRVKTATNNSSTVTFNYDAIGRLIAETNNGRTVSYSYNLAGRTQTTVYPDNTVVTKNFDTRNRLTGISKNNVPLVTYQYDVNDNMIQKTFANGVVTTAQYDAAGRLVAYSTGSGGSIQNTTLSYDNENNKTAVTRLNTPNKSEQYIYDNSYRLIDYKRGPAGSPVIHNTYTYDALGNRIAASLNGVITNYTVNNLNQVTSTSGGTNINYVYDNNGNLTYDGHFYKTYDAEGRLLKDSAAPANVITYFYDAFNRRVRRSLNGTPLNYTFSGLSAIEERDGGGIIKNKTYFNNFLSPVLNEKSGTPFFYHNNDLNSVEAMTNTQGYAVEKYEYDVYGKMTLYDSAGNALNGSQMGNRFGFTGQQFDTATGANHFYFREYNPETGLFNQRDLIGYGDGMGMYQYVHNNPANGVDIWGLEGTEDPCYHDKNKIRLISGRMTFLETQIATKAAYESKYEMDFGGSHKGLGGYFNTMSGAGNWATGASWITYGRQADSRFYGDIYNSTVANNEFYFMGNSLKSWEVNYFFTNSALRNANFSQTISGGLTNSWNTGKAVASGIKNFSYNAYKERMREGINKSRLADKAYENNPKNLIWLKKEDDFEQNEFGQFWPVINPKTGEISREFFRNREMTHSQLERFKEWAKTHCPQNTNTGGNNKKPPPGFVGPVKSTEIVQSYDPNAIIGPDGQPDKHWVSVHDRMPYTILYENSAAATAPAKFVRITSPVETKQDAGSFQLGSFGFNNQTFTVPTNIASYYQRLDCRDSLGLYVDITAGYDVVNNQFFWEFQSIDPITLLPPSDPLKGFLLLQDSTQPSKGHAFVNFSIKPVQSALTLDTISAHASIVFDSNDTIPTNRAKNTIDAFAPTTHMGNLPANSINVVNLTWSGTDDVNGCGLKFYTLYVSTDGVNFNVLRSGITRTDTTFHGANATMYYFFVLGTDSVGNTETLRPGEVKSTFFSVSLPVTWLYFKGTNQGKDNFLEWATGSEQNTREFIVERSLDASNYAAIGSKPAAGNSSNPSSYNYTDRNVDRLGSNIMFYRIKQMDLDGRHTYSNIVRLALSNNGDQYTIVYPNPTNGMITIAVSDKQLIGTMAVLYDVNGRMLETIKISANAQPLDLGRYVNGVYMIRLVNKEVLKIVKQ